MDAGAGASEQVPEARSLGRREGEKMTNTCYASSPSSPVLPSATILAALGLDTRPGTTTVGALAGALAEIDATLRAAGLGHRGARCCGRGRRSNRRNRAARVDTITAGALVLASCDATATAITAATATTARVRIAWARAATAQR